MTTRTALILGASGMVGGFCLKALLDSPEYGSVIVMTRRELALAMHPKLTQKIVNFDSLTATDFAGAQDIFCALGTTIRKAGSQEAFRRVDLEYPLAAAKQGLSAGARQFLLVSSAGADAASKNFYLHTKGELEQKLGELGYQALHIFCPGLLLGKREEVRPGELLATRIAPFVNLTLWGPLRHYRSIRAETVGKAMVAAAAQGKSGTVIYEYDEIRKLGEAVGTQ
jgi:uncharacterized protein YbjT (DUF2867 family)